MASANGIRIRVLGTQILLALAVLLCPAAAKAAEPFDTWAAQAEVPVPTSFKVVQDSSSPYVDPSSAPRTIHFWTADMIKRDPETARMLFYHELGHVYDNTALSWPTRRAIYVKLFNNSRDSLWMWQLVWGEKFGMAYSWCAAGITRVKDTWPWYWGYGYWPTQTKQSRVCSLIRQG